MNTEQHNSVFAGIVPKLILLGAALVLGEIFFDFSAVFARALEHLYMDHFDGGLPHDYRPSNPAEAIDFWETRPSVAFITSVLLTLSAIIVALFFPQQRRLAMILISITVMRHLYWRTFYTLDFDNTASAVVGILLYFAEIYGVISILLGCFQMYRPIWRDPPDRILKEGFLPSVDILVPTYSEPIDVLFRTAVGCLNMDYPNKTVYLLDDGNREDVREMCQQLGCGYIRRDNNDHAKAGNLNNGLKFTAGSLVVIFDADHVPVRNFLQRTVPYFIDKQLAYVQTPQHFCTPDPFQRNLLVEKDIANEQDLFYHVILPGVDSLGAVTFAGSGTVFRRDALEDVEGFAIETVTEDIHTGLRLHNLGWKSLYVNEDLSAGLAPETFEDFLNQRIRWAQGATQVFILEDVLRKKGLTLLQKLSYFNALWYFLHGLPRVIFLLIPLAYLLFGVVTIQAYYLDVLTYYFCYFVVCSVAYTQMSGQVRQTQWSELYETVLCFHLSLITFLTFLNPYDAKFRVTPKGQKHDAMTFAGMSVAPHMIILALTIIGMGLGTLKAVQDPSTTGLMIWNGFWACYNLILLGCALLVAFNRPQKRSHPRIPRQVDVAVVTPLKTVQGFTKNLSEGGALLILDEPIPVTHGFDVDILDWTLKRQTKLTCEAVQSHVDPQGRHHISVRFVHVSPDHRENLILHAFSDSDTWSGYHEHKGGWASLQKLIETPMRWFTTREHARRRLAPRFVFDAPCTLTDPAGNLMAIGAVQDISETGVSVQLSKIYDTLPLLKRLRLRISWPGSDGKETIREYTVEALRRIVAEQAGDASSSGEEQTYNLIFRNMSPDQVQHIQQFLYERGNLSVHSVEVVQANQAKLAQSSNSLFGFLRQRQQTRPSNMAARRLDYIPFGLSITRVPILSRDERIKPHKRSRRHRRR